MTFIKIENAPVI